jgi:hypothetical protein
LLDALPLARPKPGARRHQLKRPHLSAANF